jgi:hypothetical protein
MLIESMIARNNFKNVAPVKPIPSSDLKIF